eukprot:m.172853 g.172853  ORF g.172853 m.172853 type:complete len:347 (+) comp39087_c0_seq5:29-1069(+)
MTSEFEEGGYDAEFVEPLDKDLECPVCMSALKEPVLTSCGHNFCCICAEKLTKYGKFQCPLDNQECQERDVFRDRKVERKVLSLLVYCSRKDQGCSWKGELRDIEGHIGERGNCSYAELSCPFSEVGCTAKLKRTGIEMHLNNEQVAHLELMMKRILSQDKVVAEQKRTVYSLEQKVESQSRKIEELQGALRRSSRKLSFTWRIENWQETLQEAKTGKKRDIYSEPYYTSFPGYKFCLNVYPNGWGSEEGANVGLALRLMRGEYDNSLVWPFPFNYSLHLVDQSGGAGHLKEIEPNTVTSPEAFLKPNSRMNVGHGWSGFITHSDLQSKGFVKNNCLVVQANVQQQ